MSAPPGAGAIRTLRWPRPALGHAFLVAGLALAAVLVWRTGIADISALLVAAGWAAALVPLPHALVAIAETSGWWFAFGGAGCPVGFAKLLRFTVSAKAIQMVTPSLAQGGEFLRLYLLRQAGVPSDMATASVVTAKATITAAELAFVVVGLLALLGTRAIDPTVATWAFVGLACLAAGLSGVVVWLRLGLFRPLVSLARRLHALRGLADRHGALLSSTDAILREYLVEHRRRFAASGVAFFGGWAAGVIEAWTFLAILGVPGAGGLALLIQAWLVTVSRLTAFVPGNVGTQEAGAVLAFAFLGLPAEAALAFALLRRVRQLVWVAAGLALLRRASP